MARNNKEKNKPVIGMDFGNCYSFLSYISDFDGKTRLGGNVHDLLPGGLNEGIRVLLFKSSRYSLWRNSSARTRKACAKQN